MYLSEDERTATLDEYTIVNDQLRKQKIGVTLLGVIDANLQHQQFDQLDTTLTDLETALYFQETFEDHRITVERYNTSTMEFEEA